LAKKIEDFLWFHYAQKFYKPILTTTAKQGCRSGQSTHCRKKTMAKYFFVNVFASAKRLGQTGWIQAPVA